MSFLSYDYVELSPGDGDATNTATNIYISVPSYVPNKTIMWLTTRGQSSTPRAEMYTVEKVTVDDAAISWGTNDGNATTRVRIQRGASDVTNTLGLHILQFSSGVTVRDYESTNATDVTITAVNLSTSFIVPLGQRTTVATDWNNTTSVTGKFNGTTTLQVDDGGGSDANRVNRWQVVTYTNCAVTSIDLGTTNWTATTESKTISPAVDPRKTWILPTIATDSQLGVGDEDFWTNVTINSAGTSLTINRQGTAQVTLTGNAFLVEFTDDTRVSRDAIQDQSTGTEGELHPITSFGPTSVPYLSGGTGVFGCSSGEYDPSAAGTDFSALKLVRPGFIGTDGQVGARGDGFPPIVHTEWNDGSQDFFGTVQTIHWDDGGSTPNEAALGVMITSPTSTGVVRYELPQLHGATVKAVMLLPSAIQPKLHLPGSYNDNHLAGTGFTDGTNEYAITMGSQAGVTTTVVRQEALNDAAVVLIDMDNNTDVAYAVATLGNGYFELDWEDVLPVRYLIQCYVFAGTGVSAQVANTNFPQSTSSGNGPDQTGISFQPDMVLTHIHALTYEARASRSGYTATADHNWGVAVDAGTIQQWGYGYYAVNGAGTASLRSSVLNTRIGHIDDGGSRDSLVKVDAFLSNGVSFVQDGDTNTGADHDIAGLFLAFSSGGAWAGSFDSPTSVGSTTWTDVDNINDATAAASYSSSGGATPPANSVLLASFVAEDGAGRVPTPTVTGYGLTWEPLSRNYIGYDDAGSTRELFVYMATTGGSPSSGNLTIDFGAVGTREGVIAHITGINRVDLDNPVRQLYQAPHAPNSETTLDLRRTVLQDEILEYGSPVNPIFGVISWNNTNTPTLDGNVTAIRTTDTQSTASLTTVRATAEDTVYSFSNAAANRRAGVLIELRYKNASSITSPGFAPSLVAGIFTKNAGFDTADPWWTAADGDESNSWGFVDQYGNKGSVGKHEDYNAGTTEPWNTMYGSPILVWQGGTQATEMLGDLYLTASGFDYSYHVTLGTARKQLIWAIEAPVATVYQATGTATLVATYAGTGGACDETDLIPDGDNLTTNVAFSAGSTAWDLIDDDPASPTSDHVLNATAGNVDLRVTLTDLPVKAASADPVKRLDYDIVVRKRSP